MALVSLQKRPNRASLPLLSQNAIREPESDPSPSTESDSAWILDFQEFLTNRKEKLYNLSATQYLVFLLQQSNGLSHSLKE